MLQQFGYMIHEFLLKKPFIESECQNAETEGWLEPFCKWRGGGTFGARQLADFARLTRFLMIGFFFEMSARAASPPFSCSSL